MDGDSDQREEEKEYSWKEIFFLACIVGHFYMHVYQLSDMGEVRSAYETFLDQAKYTLQNSCENGENRVDENEILRLTDDIKESQEILYSRATAFMVLGSLVFIFTCCCVPITAIGP